jgi:hypothetical protein
LKSYTTIRCQWDLYLARYCWCNSWVDNGVGVDNGVTL